MVRICAALFVLAVAGCYSPQLSNPGFYCHPEDNPACPDGQQCVNGRCQAEGVSVSGNDLGGVGGGPNGDMGAASGGDMASKPVDMAKPVDLSQSQPPDLSQGGSCGMTGDPCTGNGDCCSGMCFVVLCL